MVISFIMSTENMKVIQFIFISFSPFPSSYGIVMIGEWKYDWLIPYYSERINA